MSDGFRDGAPGKIPGMRTLILGTLALAAAVLIAAGPAAGASNKTFTVKMTGKQETPKGDPNGSGTATLTFEPGKGKVCFKLTWSSIGAPQASHIHKGPRGKAGNVVIVLFGTPPAKHSGCVSAKKSLINAIIKSPGAYYVNVHTKAFPAGAIRGQL